MLIWLWSCPREKRWNLQNQIPHQRRINPHLKHLKLEKFRHTPRQHLMDFGDRNWISRPRPILETRETNGTIETDEKPLKRVESLKPLNGRRAYLRGQTKEVEIINRSPPIIRRCTRIQILGNPKKSFNGLISENPNYSISHRGTKIQIEGSPNHRSSVTLA